MIIRKCCCQRPAPLAGVIGKMCVCFLEFLVLAYISERILMIKPDPCGVVIIVREVMFYILISIFIFS